MSNKHRGLLFVVSSPSGAGKTTLCTRLRGEFAQIRFSVSYTTRSPRPGEVHGREYFFVDPADFTEMVTGDEFAEYALVHGNNYGTSAALVGEALASGIDLLFDIDYQGGRQLKAKFPGDVVLVFILPPSLAELERRLRARNTDAAEVSRHESGARCPSVPLLARYAEVLEVPIYELLRFDEPSLTLG